MSCELAQFPYLLALTFCCGDEPWNVDALLEAMGETWFAKWWCYYQVNPWGPERDDWRMRRFAEISRVPGDPRWMSYATTFEAVRQLKELTSDAEEQQPLSAALEVLKGVSRGK